MADAVTLRHPKLPPAQTITVPARAVPHWARSGWEPADQPTTATPPAVDGEAPEPDEPKGRRAPKKES